MQGVGPVFRYLYSRYSTLKFGNSEKYWITRYAKGGNSGAGSYNRLAEQKAEVINRFVVDCHIKSVIEFGCGDGNQLRLAIYPQYIGFDISPVALALCNELFRDDQSKSFRLIQDYAGETAHCTLSLDVIYHLVEDDVFDAYMRRLFQASTRFVIIYSSNKSDQEANIEAPIHVKHREFTSWVEAHMPEWQLRQYIPNRYPYSGDPAESSFADFYIYERT
jgi:SAM-dependent methyltransferase